MNNPTRSTRPRLCRFFLLLICGLAMLTLIYFWSNDIQTGTNYSVMQRPLVEQMSIRNIHDDSPLYKDSQTNDEARSQSKKPSTTGPEADEDEKLGGDSQLKDSDIETGSSYRDLLESAVKKSPYLVPINRGVYDVIMNDPEIQEGLRQLGKSPKMAMEDVMRYGLGLEPYTTELGEEALNENGVIHRPPRPPEKEVRYPSPHVPEIEEYVPFDHAKFFEGRPHPPVNDTERKIILWWVQTRYWPPTSGLSPLRVCPEFPCVITTNRNYTEQSSAMLATGLDVRRLREGYRSGSCYLEGFSAATPAEMCDSPSRNEDKLKVNAQKGDRIWERPPQSRRPDQVFIFSNHEPEGNWFKNAELNKPNTPWKQVFNWTMTYHFESDVTSLYGISRKRHAPITRDYEAIFANKTKMVAWIVSNCNTPGQRHRYVKELSKYIPVDTYGNCGKLKCPRANDDECFQMVNRTYKFYLSFESNLCTDYISEKVFRYLAANTITVARASNEFYRHAPSEIFLNTADYPSPKALAERMLHLANNKEDYINMLIEKDKYMFPYEDYPIRKSSGKIHYMHYHYEAVAFCEVCQRLWNLDKYKGTVPDIGQWLRERHEECKKPTDLNF